MTAYYKAARIAQMPASRFGPFAAKLCRRRSPV